MPSLIFVTVDSEDGEPLFLLSEEAEQNTIGLHLTDITGVHTIGAMGIYIVLN